MDEQSTKNITEDDERYRRKYEVKVRLNQDEKRILDAKTKVSGLRSREALLRELIVMGNIYQVDFREIHQFNAELGKIGSNINQIAHVANASQMVRPEQIEIVKEEQEKIWQLQRSILSKLRLTKP